MFKTVKVKKLDIVRYLIIAGILNSCGKDMADKYNLHHWDNSFVKSIIIVLFCALKNDIFLVYENSKPVATYMINGGRDCLHFEKLATLPAESGRGVGSFCMRQIEKEAKRRNKRIVRMEVYEPSQHAISFYIHKGYKKTGVIDTLKYKEVKMEKRI